MKTLSKLFVAIILTAGAVIAQAQTQVSVIWPWSPSNPPLNYVRHIINQANQNQKDYHFILELKPGGSGVVSANHALALQEHNKLAIYATSNGFFTRAALYNQPGYRLEDFKLIRPIATMPMALVSKKNKSFEEIVSKKASSITTVGQGTLSHVMSHQVRQAYPSLALIPYNGTREGTNDVIGGHVDLALDFLAPVVDDDKVTIIGTTGNKKIRNIPLLAEKDKNLKALGTISIKFFMLVPAKINNNHYNKIQAILEQAQKNNPELQVSLDADFAHPDEVNAKDYKTWYATQIAEIERHTKGMAKLD